ncbi:hypothetical protein CDAR_585221 [Caerostris darwini]|uniref:C2H2-type domain-containing protein n=1 Tax=Caerostris darwini TaxID=1538125 RepID=A0AAV4TTW8_9ARAC|nr:hypothetical protein CDAR_585221 [Caerostris darwini]
MDYEALWPSLLQSSSSTQQNILRDIYQRTDCEETAAAVMPSQQGVANQNPYNPETSDFPFPHIQENELAPTHLKQQSEVNNVFINQYPQNYEPSNPKRPDNPAKPIATRCVLPGFQETFGRRNPMSNTILPSANSVNCEQNSEEKNLDLCTGVCEQNADEPQKTKNTLHKCSRCPMKFKRKHYLVSHERVPNVEKPYVCSFCDKVFINTGNLATHIRTHTGEKPFSCDKCGKCFPDSSNLSKHFGTHTGEKPYACNKCNKTYSENRDLKHHMLKHADKERCKCYYCGYEFSSKESLGGHP